jgi:hypothetical protein
VSKNTLEQCVEIFAKNVASQSEAIMEGNSKKGNRDAKRYISAFQTLRQYGNEGLEALTVLLRHSRPDVRGAAACFLLRCQTQESLTVLKEVAQLGGLAGFEAQECMKRWDEGTWQLDPEPDP